MFSIFLYCITIGQTYYIVFWRFTFTSSHGMAESQSTKMSIKLNLDSFCSHWKRLILYTKNVAKWKGALSLSFILVQVFVTISICNIVVEWHSCSCFSMVFLSQWTSGMEIERARARERKRAEGKRRKKNT